MAKLDPHFTFENFVVGPANRLASAAARRAAERPGVSYNPLFIYAPLGLGKTHLLGAMARHIAKVSPGKEVKYQTAQEFLREFVQASGPTDEGEVRELYGSLDILLLDDVQFLTAEPDVQSLLLLTLDTLTGDGKQVALASDRPPAEIDGLGAHLRTRFEGGLLVNIGAPEYETRVAIIQKVLEGGKNGLGPGVADAMGRFPFPTVTELHSALNRILDLQAEENRVVSPEEATAVIERGEHQDPEPTASELGQFLDELSDTVAEKVQAQEAPWRKLLRELAEEVEEEDFRADGLRRAIDGDTQPRDLGSMVDGFRETVRRLKGIREELEAAGNPWPEAAYGVLRDPERLDEAEALLASAKERARGFPEIPSGPVLQDLGGEVPQLVIRAADRLVKTDRPEYNPLYVWSPGGTAALALLQAAARTKLLDEEESRVALSSIGKFAEEFIHALSLGVAGAWRERWWSADLLLVNGVQELSATERAQEEFLHLFEALQRRRARIMVAADRPPASIPGLDDRLRARLDGGLVIEIEVEASDLSPELLEAVQAAAPEEPPTGPEETEEAESEEAEGRGEDISHKDREWIKSFQPGGPMSSGSSATGEQSAEGGFLDVLAGGNVPSTAGEPWIPSPEQVVWDWPKIEERLVEEAG